MVGTSNLGSCCMAIDIIWAWVQIGYPWVPLKVEAEKNVTSCDHIFLGQLFELVTYFRLTIYVYVYIYNMCIYIYLVGGFNPSEKY